MTEEKKTNGGNGNVNPQVHEVNAPTARPGALDWMINGIKTEAVAAPQRVEPMVAPAVETVQSVPEVAAEREPESVTAVQKKTEQPETEAVEEPTKGISIRIPASLHRRIMNIKYSDGENLTALVIQALEEFVARKEVAMKKN